MKSNDKRNAKNTTTNKKKLILTFDADERKKYLQGFSARKQQRRAYGLAMQKVKDRQRRLEERREHRKLEQERVEEAERQKRQVIDMLSLEKGIYSGLGTEAATTTTKSNDFASSASNEVPSSAVNQSLDEVKQSVVITYDDLESNEIWGGNVVVTTRATPMDSCNNSMNSDDDNDDDDDNDNDDDKGEQVSFAHRQNKPEFKKGVDEQQRYAGDVQKYLKKQGTISSSASRGGDRRSRNHHHPRKGKHGASNMAGIGGEANLKLAKKVLSKVQQRIHQKVGNGSKKKRKGRQK